MNVAAEKYPPREFKQPAGLKNIEICSRSGLLATDKCYDAVKSATGDTVQRRTTYEEIATEAQAPTEPCNIHGEPRARLARELPAAEFPRASLAVDLNDVTPVIMKTPTLLADKDPYNSARPNIKTPVEPEKAAVEKAVEVKKAEPVTPDSESIPKAIPVAPDDKKPEEPVEIRKAVPVGPLDEIKDGTLLESATPPPNNDDDQR